MIRIIVLFTFIFILNFHINAQNKKDCNLLDGITDTIICDQKKLILDLHFCEFNKLYHDGVLTDINGKEEFVFFYIYDSQNKIKKITFWTFEWKNGGYVTTDKIGELKFDEGKEKLNVKSNFLLSREFVKLITKY